MVSTRSNRCQENTTGDGLYCSDTSETNIDMLALLVGVIVAAIILMCLLLLSIFSVSKEIKQITPSLW